MKEMSRYLYRYILMILCLSVLPAYALNEQADEYPTAKIFGFVHFWTQTQYVNKTWDNTQFRLARARLGVQGKIKESLTFCALTECGELAYPNSVNPSSKGVSLVDCHLTYQLHSLLNLRVGQDYHRFTYEGDLILPKLPFIFRAEAIDAVWLPLGRVGSYAYDVGIYAFGTSEGGTIPVCGSYQLALTNGTGLAKSDDNEAKDLIGRMYIEPLKKSNLSYFRNLHLGGSFFLGTSTVVTEVATNKMEDLSEMAYAVEFVLPTDHWRLMSEAVFSDYNGAGEVPEWKQSGYYFAVGYSPLKNIEILGRYALYNQNEAVDDAELQTTTIGLTYTFAKLSSIKLNYLLREVGKGYPNNPGDLLIAQVQFMW